MCFEKMFKRIFPFTAIVGQERVKQALLLNAVNPRIGGVLLRGEKGTAKSTMVRALAELLPEIDVVKNCPYSCDPNDPRQMCDDCRGKHGDYEVTKRKVKVVTLPLNATEDRVAGGIDFSLAIKQGIRAVYPGLLAEANRSILYVDEVNLLDDHIVDIILDAAASGWNKIEREGISFRHPASFVLIGTMNPEEGELRPQLLDRFGLCLEVTGVSEAEMRIELMLKREAFDSDPETFIANYRRKNDELARKIAVARRNLPRVIFPDYLRSFIAELCKESFVAGHRADLVLEQAARAHSVLEGRDTVSTDDIIAVSDFVLLHRRRDPAPPPPPQVHNHEDEKADSPDKTESQGERQQSKGNHGNQNNSEKSDSRPLPEQQSKGSSDETENLSGVEREEVVFEIGRPFSVKNISSGRDKIYRRGSGRRSRTRVFTKQGRYVKSSFLNLTGDIALDATLRAAAPYQKKRSRTPGLVITLRDTDIREKIREKKTGNFLLFVVDASGSMGARGRMVASKGAIMSLLLDAYQKRDKVAMISFRRQDAVLNLPPTSSVELAGKLLAEMPVGGRTPLSAGLVTAHREITKFLLRDPQARPIVLIITDGKTNVSLSEKKPVEEALNIAKKMCGDPRVTYVVVDTEEQGLVTFGLARKLAVVLGARYFKIEDLKMEQLVEIVKETR